MGYPRMNIAIVESGHELESMQPEWNRLLASTENNVVHLTHAWMTSWWDSFGAGNRLHILVISDDHGAMVGIAPCMRSTMRYRGISVNAISLLANGYSPSSSVITKERDMNRVVRAMLGYFECMDSWDILDFHKIRKSGPLYSILMEQMQNRRWYGIKENIESPYIQIDTDWKSFLRARSPKFRKVMRNKINRVNRVGDLRVDRINIESRNDPALQEMIDISGRSWKRTVGGDLVSCDKGRNFLLTLCDRMGPSGMVQLWFVKNGSMPIAYEFQLVYNGIVYPIRADFDEQFRSLSPGSFLQYQILKTLFQESTMAEYYTCGHHYDYLLRWTDKTSKHVNVELFNKKTIPHGLHAFEYKVMPVLRKIKVNTGA